MFLSRTRFYGQIIFFDGRTCRSTSFSTAWLKLSKPFTDSRVSTLKITSLSVSSLFASVSIVSSCVRKLVYAQWLEGGSCKLVGLGGSTPASRWVWPLLLAAPAIQAAAARPGACHSVVPWNAKQCHRIKCVKVCQTKCGMPNNATE